MRRRSLLGGALGTLNIGIVGCLSGAPSRDSEVDAGDPEGEVDLQEDPAPVSLSRSDGPDAWRQLGYDEHNSNFASGSTGPAGEPVVDWTVRGDVSLFPPVIEHAVYLTENWTDGGAISLAKENGGTRWSNPRLPPSRWAPALYDERVLVITRTEDNLVRLHALEADSGEPHWETEITASSTSYPPSGPTVAEQELYIGSSTGILSLDANSGTERWHAHLRDHVVERADGSKGLTIWTKPAVTAERVITFDENAKHPDRLRVYAVDRDTGDNEWTTEIDLGEHWRLHGHPVVGDKHVFCIARHSKPVPASTEGSDAEPMSRLYTIDEKTGTAVWYWEIEGVGFEQPAYGDGYLFIGDNGGTLRAIDVADRSIAWQYESPIRWLRPPTITSEHVFLSSGSELTAIRTTDGAFGWKIAVDDRLSSPHVADGAVYVVTGDLRGSRSEVVAVRGA